MALHSDARESTRDAVIVARSPIGERVFAFVFVLLSKGGGGGGGRRRRQRVGELSNGSREDLPTTTSELVRRTHILTD